MTRSSRDSGVHRIPIGIADRRRFRRTSFDPPLPSSVGDTPALLVDLSVAGALVEHDTPLPTRHPIHLSFEWYEPIEVDARVVRTEEIDGRLRSALQILIPSGPLVRSIALQISSATIARLQSLVEASKLINSAIEPDALIESILTVARKELGVHSGTVYLLDHRRHKIWTDLIGEAGPLASLRILPSRYAS